MAVVALLLIVVGAWWYVDGSPRLEAQRHVTAMQKWPEFVQNGFRGEVKEIASSFRACFRKGDPVSKYESQLIGSKQHVYADTKEGSYDWYWDRGFGGEGDAVFQVYYQGEPPVIWLTAIAEVCW